MKIFLRGRKTKCFLLYWEYTLLLMYLLAVFNFFFFTNISINFYTLGLGGLHSRNQCHLNARSTFCLQISKAVQGDENQSAPQLVPANPQGPPLPAHSDSAHHPQGLEVRQHFYHRSDGFGQDRRPGPGHAQTCIIRQECHRYDPKSPPPVCRRAAPQRALGFFWRSIHACVENGEWSGYIVIYEGVVPKQTTVFQLSLKPQLKWRPNTVVISGR